MARLSPTILPTESKSPPQQVLKQGKVGPEGFEPSTHGLRVRPGWSKNRASAPINGNFPKTVSHMLPREVDLTPLKREIFGQSSMD